MRFVRTQPVWRGVLITLAAAAVVLDITLQGVFPIPGTFYHLAAFFIAVLVTAPYLVDRIVAARMRGILATLVFPCAVTSVWYLWAPVSPSGTWLNPAYTQYGNLPLLQLQSVTGVWGIVFLMAWLASVANWAWERDFVGPSVRRGSLLYASTVAVVLLFGGGRLALFPPHAATVRVAGVSPSPAALVELDRQLSRTPEQSWSELSSLQQRLLSGTSTQADREAFRRASAPVFDDLLARTEQEARAGARIIVWSECRVAQAEDVLEEDESALIARAADIARATGSYLDLNMCVLLQQPRASSFALDQNTLIDPTRGVAWVYQKAHPVPGEPEMPGDGQVPTIDTPYGRLSNVICYDLDFLDIIRQSGQASADMLLVPAGDWQEIDPIHTRIATFAAIAGGYSLVRGADMGLSMAVDYEGNVLAASDYFTTNPQTLVAYVPTQGVRTIYATVGDLFAWLSIVALVAFTAGVTIRPKFRRRGQERGWQTN